MDFQSKSRSRWAAVAVCSSSIFSRSTKGRRIQRVGKCGAALLLLLMVASAAQAGGGPENVFLIVNSADNDSLTIANNYADWRKIPATCVFGIDWPNAPMRTDVATFRSKLLIPILKEIKNRKLSKQIDYIVYSSGFPYAVNFSDDLVDPSEKHPVASLTGLTYLYELVLEKNAKYRFDLTGRNTYRVNSYAQNALPDHADESRGFSAQSAIGPNGERTKSKSAPRYYLSMMLGATRGPRNNTVREVMRYLTRAVTADGKKPAGTIYYVKTSDVRSTTRHDLFAEAVATLKELGVNAEEVEGASDPIRCLPVEKSDVMGAMTGRATFTWRASKSTILPGAICENFTSHGGLLAGTSQTLLCEFLRHGAAASSGTVIEPYALAAKFPHPRIHVHYARGCSVAEAFYQSLLAPYQQIIVGDPLCQPWAVAPEVKLSGVDLSEPVTGSLKFDVDVKSKTGAKIRNVNVYVDGVMAVRTSPDAPITWDTTKLPDGHHELRVVAVEDTLIETQGRTIANVVTANNKLKSASQGDISCSMIPKSRKMRFGGMALLRVRSPNAREIRIYKGRDLLGRVKGESGQIRIHGRELGSGPSTLTPVAVPSSSKLKPVFGAPLKVTVLLDI